MTTFRYQALTKAGELVNGELTAPHRGEVLQRIEYLGLIPVQTEAMEDGSWSLRALLSRDFTWKDVAAGGPRGDDVTSFSRDLAILLRSGIRLDQALDLLSDPEMTGALAPVVARLHTQLRSGESLAGAMAQHPRLFPRDFVALVRIGESSGKLASVVEALAEQRTRMAALRRSAVDALRYPAFLLAAALAVLLFFLLVVLPKFATVFQDLGTQLDPIVRTLLWLSDVVRTNGWAVGLAAAAAGASVGALMRMPGLRARAGTAALRLPVLRTLSTHYRTAVFCRMLGTLLGNGVQLPAALQLVTEAVSDPQDAEAWHRSREQVRQGVRLADALVSHRDLVPVALRMLRIGEEAGELPAIALRAADLVEARLERHMKRLSAAVGPAAILGIAAIVGGLMVSLMSSLISIGQLAN